jgi:uncharacterized membrane protein
VTILENWFIEYWWIPASLLYVIVLIIVMLVLAGRGTFERTWPKITLATTCIMIILIPTMHSPTSYVMAAVSVFNLLTLFRSTFTSERSSEAVDR